MCILFRDMDINIRRNSELSWKCLFCCKGWGEKGRGDEGNVRLVIRFLVL